MAERVNPGPTTCSVDYGRVVGRVGTLRGLLRMKAEGLWVACDKTTNGTSEDCSLSTLYTFAASAIVDSA